MDNFLIDNSESGSYNLHDHRGCHGLSHYTHFTCVYNTKQDFKAAKLPDQLCVKPNIRFIRF